MLETSARLLELLSLLQSRPTWTGPELAQRLGVTTRTVRNDVDRLRTLGYPVHAALGSTGHYRLGAGARLPPLLLDDEEAVAVAIGLRAAAGVAGIGESSSRALAKLEQVLPNRLRPTVAAVHASVDKGPENTARNVEDPGVDPAVLGALATAIRSSECVRFDYHSDAAPGRAVPPRELAGTLVPRRSVTRHPGSGGRTGSTG
jgi:predicted DNA-binding transcriptional regulator YafY